MFNLCCDCEPQPLPPLRHASVTALLHMAVEAKVWLCVRCCAAVMPISCGVCCCAQILPERDDAGKMLTPAQLLGCLCLNDVPLTAVSKQHQRQVLIDVITKQSKRCCGPDSDCACADGARPALFLSVCCVLLSRCHPVTLSPCHPVTLSPCHPVTLSPCHPVVLIGRFRLMLTSQLHHPVCMCVCCVCGHAESGPCGPACPCTGAVCLSEHGTTARYNHSRNTSVEVPYLHVTACLPACPHHKRGCDVALWRCCCSTGGS